LRVNADAIDQLSAATIRATAPLVSIGIPLTLNLHGERTLSRTAERCKEFSRGLSERSDEIPRSATRVPRTPQG
jgi:hypothetical protein